MSLHINEDEHIPTEGPSSSGAHTYPIEDMRSTGNSIADTASNVARIGQAINPEVTGKSFGELNGEFAGAAMAHVQQTKAQVNQAVASISAASEATHSTAGSYENTDQTAAKPFQQLLSDDQNSTPSGTTDTTTPSSTTNESGPVTPPKVPTGETDPNSTQPSDAGGPGAPGGPGGPGRPGDGTGGYCDDNGYHGPLPPSTTTAQRPPVDPTRPAKLEQIDMNDPSRVTKTPDGRIDTIDGLPVKQWTRERALQRGQEVRDQINDPNNVGRNKITKGSIDGVSSVGIDRSTGQVWEGVNGSKASQIPPNEVHPLMQQRADSIENGGPYATYPHQSDPNKVIGPDGRVQPALDENGNPRHQTWIQNDPPLRHAEVKVLNQMLHDHPEIDPNGDPAVVNKQIGDLFSVESVRPIDRLPVQDVPYCGNCNVMMGGVSNVAERNTHAVGHPDNQQIP